MQALKKRSNVNRLQTAMTWIKDGKVDSRDFYECIPHVSIMKIISELDKQSHFGSIEGLLTKQGSSGSRMARQTSDESEAKGVRKESNISASSLDKVKNTGSREEAKKQLKTLNDSLFKVQIATCALIASFTKKIKQMIYHYLLDFSQGPIHLDPEGNRMSQKTYIVDVFNDLIRRITRKAVYCCDSDMDIGKAQFCFYMIKFSKNREIKQKIEFIEKNLSMLLNFEDDDS